MINGNFNLKERLRSGDVIFIEPRKSVVSIDGAIKRPAKYELADQEYLDTALRFANGIKNTADMQNIFLELRKGSISERVESRLLCGHCEKPNDVMIDLNDFKLVTGEGHTKEIRLADNVTVEMRYPNPVEISQLANAQDAESSDIFKVAEQCIDKVYYEDTIIDGEDFDEKAREEFIENLESTQFALLRAFFETMPAIENELKFVCKSCEKENVVYLNGYFDFFV